MSVSRDMSEMEIRVLNMIMNCATFDLPIQASEIRLETGLSKRSWKRLSKACVSILATLLEKYWEDSA